MPDSLFEVDGPLDDAAHKRLNASLSPNDSLALIKLQTMNFKLGFVCKMNSMHVTKRSQIQDIYMGMVYQ